MSCEQALLLRESKLDNYEGSNIKSSGFKMFLWKVVKKSTNADKTKKSPIVFKMYIILGATLQ